MNRNKLYSALMAGTMILGSTLPVFATVVDYDPIAQSEIGDDGLTKETEVLYTEAASYSVIIPKTITLDGTSKAADYTVKVGGNISSDTNVTVVPETAFEMIDKGNGSAHKANVPATVEQEKTAFAYDEINKADKAEAPGTVAAPTITAGSWRGTFNFNISLVSVAVATPEVTE